MFNYKVLKINLILVAFFILVGKANSSTFKWGEEGFLPSNDQVAFASQPYEKGDLVKLRVEPLDDQDVDQANVLELSVPKAPCITQVLDRSSEAIRFNLNVRPILSQAIFKNEITNEEIMNPLDIMQQACLGHGVLFSLFRAKIGTVERDAEGKEMPFATGRVAIGTAFLVSPNCLITAAHNVVLNHHNRNYGPLIGFNPYAESIEFWPYFNGLTRSMFQNDKK